MSKGLSLAIEDVANLESLQANGEVIFIPLGGGCMALSADRLQVFNRPEERICDRDNPSGQESKCAAHVTVDWPGDGRLLSNSMAKRTIVSRDSCSVHTKSTAYFIVIVCRKGGP